MSGMTEQGPEMSDELHEDLTGLLWSLLRPRGFCDADIDHVIGEVEGVVYRELLRRRCEILEAHESLIEAERQKLYERITKADGN